MRTQTLPSHLDKTVRYWQDIGHDNNSPHLQAIADMTTEALIERFRQWPTADAQAELEGRGVVLWHHSLRPVTR